jgi:large subunit ribosomal protein L4
MAISVEVKSEAGKPNGEMQLPEHLFDARVSDYALYRAVVAFETNQRQGNASTKTRSEIARTSKKRHRQKGTGMARRGSLRSPIVRGGGVAFGPKPRNYSLKVPRTLRRLAFRSALTLKGRAGDVYVVDDFKFEEPSTKSFHAIIAACGLDSSKVLFVTPESDGVLHKSCRNIRSVEIRPTNNLCTHDIMAADVVLFTRQAVEKLTLMQGSSSNG